MVSPVSMPSGPTSSIPSARAFSFSSSMTGRTFQLALLTIAFALSNAFRTIPSITASGIAAELHAVLYLQSRSTISLLNGQAEYATRVLPALADLMAAETRAGCQHPAPAVDGIPLPSGGGPS